jgi:negative regulator of sigma E activity
MIQAEQTRVFTAREIVTREDGKSIEQVVKRDPRRGVRRELVRPEGEVLIDNGRRAWRLSQKFVRETESRQAGVQRRMKDLLGRLNRVPVSLQGQDVVAGRSADIVALFLPDGSQRRFWIDRETGLRLKTEEKGVDGRVRSGAYYVSLDLKSPLTDAEFAPPTPTPTRPVVRDRGRRVFDSIEEAGKAGLVVRAPGWVPSGFTLRTVETTGERATLRYSNGMTALSVARITHPPRRLLTAREGTLRLPGGGQGYLVRSGNALWLLIGSLPEPDLKRIADSLH